MGPRLFRREFHWDPAFWGDSWSSALRWERGNPEEPLPSALLAAHWSPARSPRSNDGLFWGSARRRGYIFLLVWSVSRGNCWDVAQSPFFLSGKWVAPAPMRKEEGGSSWPELSHTYPQGRPKENLPSSTLRTKAWGFPDQTLFINTVQWHNLWWLTFYWKGRESSPSGHSARLLGCAERFMQFPNATVTSAPRPSPQPLFLPLIGC